jgi:nitric oxide reductase activation protein
MSTRRPASRPAATPSTAPALFLAELQTRSFAFHALGTTEAKALAALRKTWEAHARQYASSVLNPVVSWAEISGNGEEVRIVALTPDAIGTRDGEAIR